MTLFIVDRHYLFNDICFLPYVCCLKYIDKTHKTKFNNINVCIKEVSKYYTANKLKLNTNKNKTI